MIKKTTERKRRSVTAFLAEKYLRFTGWKKRYGERGYRKLIHNPKNLTCKPPRRKLKSAVAKAEFCGADIFTLSKTAAPERIIVYLHGGAYVNRPLSYHWRACDKIVQATNSILVIPIYPLVPHATWKQAYTLVTALYGEIVKSTVKEIIFMGDSAGGGLCLGFCEYLRETDLPQPERVIALSPWVDVSLSNPDIPEYDKVDPMVTSYGARKIGELWAGELSVKDYRISPINGEVEGLHDIYMFIGTHELLYPDVSEFYRILQASGVTSELYIGQKLNHVYPLYPTPEGRAAMKEICRIISGK